MIRESTTLSIEELRGMFVDIEFPEYQREPDIWSRDQKQRLLDSILRRFDISSVYFYRREDDGLECIDGRQRINAIMSFLQENDSDEADNGFPLKLENEISGGLQTEFDTLTEATFGRIKAHAESNDAEMRATAKRAIRTILDYRITTVMLSGAADEEEFNLQFLRLNLGTLINSGEKLHAMVGAMRDVVFKSERIGKHPFFDSVRIPTRRYAKELTAAQVLLQAFSIREPAGFARARHLDLQRFVKRYAEIEPSDDLIEEVASTLDALRDGAGAAGGFLRNRAVTVSLVLLAWERDVASNALSSTAFWEFAEVFMTRLRWQVEKMKSFEWDPEYRHFVDFQRDLTQASVEKPAITRRGEILRSNLDRWLENGQLLGDAEYKARTGNEPGD
ncbi:MAG: DUF262 domain-containing protein [Chloroflexi bacterium]|nr:DUF262 domain-containing protein [Chloroflexota bacterium]